MKDLQDAIRHLVTQNAAMLVLLLEKGVFTGEEWARAVVKSSAMVDQVVAEKRADYLAANPGMAFLEKLLGDKP